MGQREALLDKARSQLGYVEGENNWTIYGEWFGIQGPWCAMFICWCANQVGISEDIIPKIACCDDIGEWYDERKEYKNSRYWGGNYTPVPGDLVLFDWDKTSFSDHIGIVEKVEGNTITTIEGNTDNMVARREYSLDNDNLRAFCVPAYIEVTPEPVPPEDKYAQIPRKYVNNGEERVVYADLWAKVAIGSLNANEECECFGQWGDMAIVMYEIDKVNHNWKIGFTDYLEGIK